MTIKTIIFDFDGVIQDSLYAVREAWKVIAKQFNFEEIEQEKLVSKITDYKQLYYEKGVRDPQEQAEASRLFSQTLKENEDKMPLTEDIHNIIEQLAKKYTLAIASGAHGQRIKEVLQKNDLEKHFTFIAGCEDVKEQKPSPEQVNLCLERTNTKPEETIFIGDMVTDIQAGKAAHVKTVAAAYGWHPKDFLAKAEPDHIIENPNQIFEVLKNE